MGGLDGLGIDLDGDVAALVGVGHLRGEGDGVVLKEICGLPVRSHGSKAIDIAILLEPLVAVQGEVDHGDLLIPQLQDVVQGFAIGIGDGQCHLQAHPGLGLAGVLHGDGLRHRLPGHDSAQAPAGGDTVLIRQGGAALDAVHQGDVDAAGRDHIMGSGGARIIGQGADGEQGQA